MIALNTVSRVKAFSLLWGVKTGLEYPVYSTVHEGVYTLECTTVHSASVLSQHCQERVEAPTYDPDCLLLVFLR